MGFLGRGWAFPPEFDIDIQSVVMVDSEEDIRQSLGILFSTAIGERVMRPEFGCNLDIFHFEPMNNAFMAYMKDMITKTVLLQEPRVRLESVNIQQDQQQEGKLMIMVSYMIRTSNTRDNFVYDFYLKER